MAKTVAVVLHAKGWHCPGGAVGSKMLQAAKAACCPGSNWLEKTVDGSGKNPDSFFFILAIVKHWAFASWTSCFFFNTGRRETLGICLLDQLFTGGPPEGVSGKGDKPARGGRVHEKILLSLG